MRKNPKSFTLLELLVVIIVVGILAGLALPNYMEIQRKSYAAEAWPNLFALLDAIKVYNIENEGSWPSSLDALAAQNPNSKVGAKFNYTFSVDSGIVLISALMIDTATGLCYGYILECNNCNQSTEEIIRYQCKGVDKLDCLDNANQLGG